MKTETAFTPGPWQIAHNEFCQWITNEVGKAQIAKAFHPAGMPIEVSEANARLIAEAPAMFEALQQLHRYLTDPVFAKQENDKAQIATDGNVSVWEAYADRINAILQRIG